jgi:hypothetical protein
MIYKKSIGIKEENYVDRIKGRGYFRFFIGLVNRYLIFCKFLLFRKIAEMRGAKIGKNTIIPFKLAKSANSNLIIR